MTPYMAQNASMAMEDAAVQSRGFRGASGKGAPYDERYSGGQERIYCDVADVPQSP